jgi:hypothetical protein
MPRYICHKTVHALLISAVLKRGEVGLDVDEETFVASDGFHGAELVPDRSDLYAPIEVTAEWYRKHNPVAGGYYVVYADGYTSFSPAAAFEDGYTSEEELAARAAQDVPPVEPSALPPSLPSLFDIGHPVIYNDAPHHVAGVTFGNDGRPAHTKIRYHLTRDRDNGAGQVISDVSSLDVSPAEESTPA